MFLSSRSRAGYSVLLLGDSKYPGVITTTAASIFPMASTKFACAVGEPAKGGILKRPRRACGAAFHSDSEIWRISATHSAASLAALM
jgi:hypothetical protein